MTRIFYTPEISLPYDIKVADCHPNIVTQDHDIALKYFVGNYTPRSAWYEWNKGPFAPPFLLEVSGTGTTIGYTIYFNEFQGGDCQQMDCHVQCSNQTVSFVSGDTTGSSTNFCINGDKPIYRFDVSFDDEGQRLALPALFNFTFEDSLGNINSLDVESISGIKPMNPIVGVQVDSSNASKAYVGVVLQTSSFTNISQDNLTEFIIERCDWPTRTNIRRFKGPIKNPPSSNLFIDTDISNGHEVAYRIKFKNKWKEESLNSDWVVGGI